jgi:hypothetical protein
MAVLGCYLFFCWSPPWRYFGEMFVLAISEGSLHSWLLAVFFPLLCGLSGASVIVLTKRTKRGLTDEVETKNR